MRTQMFAVFDAVAERYVDPFPSLNVAVALRNFEEACRSDDHQFTKHPEDYSLWLVGEFDPELGILTGLTPVKVGMATSYVRRQEGFPAEREMDAEIKEFLDGENGQIKELE